MPLVPSQYLRHPEVFDQVLLLEESQCKDPLTTIESILDDNPLSTCRHELSQIREWLFTTDNEQFSEASDRANAYNFLENIELLFEATSLLVENKKKSK